jgi:hypothetical protein
MLCDVCCLSCHRRRHQKTRCRRGHALGARPDGLQEPCLACQAEYEQKRSVRLRRVGAKLRLGWKSEA